MILLLSAGRSTKVCEEEGRGPTLGLPTTAVPPQPCGGDRAALLSVLTGQQRGTVRIGTTGRTGRRKRKGSKEVEVVTKERKVSAALLHYS